MAREVLPVVKHTPVLAGVNGTDPFLLLDPFLKTLGELGFSGIQNFPTVGLFDGVIRAQLEETGMGYALEVELVERGPRARPAHHPLRVLRGQRARHGARRRGHRRLPPRAHHGRRHRRPHRPPPRGLRAEIDAWAAAARGINPDILVLCHGGPIATPDDAAFILARTRHCHGFYGASSMERLPTETALTETTRTFKRIGIRLKETPS